MVKKRFWIAFLFVILIGCAIDPQFPLPDIDAENIGEMNIWVWRNIQFVEDEGQYTQKPYETLILRAGDCEDQARLLVFLSEELLAIYPSMVTIYHYGGGHTIVEYESTWYDPSYGTVMPVDESRKPWQ